MAQPGGSENLSRREFLQRGLTGAAAVVGTHLAAQLTRAAETTSPLSDDPASGALVADESAERPALPARSRVVVITHPEVLVTGYVANRPVIEQMIDRAVRELTGADSERKAWQQVAVSGDRVSMKTTRAGGAELKTHEEIPVCLARRLAEVAGVDADAIKAWDRPDLRGADMELSDPYVLPTTGRETRLRTALVRDVSAIVNLPVLKMHAGTGASIAMKNHFGSINNPSAFHGWGRGKMERSIAELSALEPIRTRTRLVVVDATRPLFEGGPLDNPKYRWTFGGLILGTDPVAVESVGLDILERKRAEHKGEPWPATDARKVVEYAARLGIGHADRRKIDLVRIDMG